MKYILLIMTILQIKTFWNSFKNIFKSNKSIINETNNSLHKIESMVDNKDIVIGCMGIVSIGLSLFLTIYYILTGIYVGNLIFAILSCVFIINTWRHMWKALKYTVNRDVSMIRKTFLSRIYSVIYLSYIGYFIYFLVTTW